MPLRSNPGFGVGEALFSPLRSSSGADIYRFMRAVQPGDAILHFVDNRSIIGISRVKREAEIIAIGTEQWYRVQLEGFSALMPALQRDVLFSAPFREGLAAIANSGVHNLFYTRHMTLSQGAYLTPLPRNVLSVINAAYFAMCGRPLATDASPGD